MPGNKPIFNADAAEEYFTMLCASYRDTANDIFKRDNEGRHASEHIWSAEYQKYLGMQIAMREVLEYFSKFELVSSENELSSNSKVVESNADRIRAMSDEELADFLSYTWATSAIAWQKDPGETLYWLQQPAEEADHDR